MELMDTYHWSLLLQRYCTTKYFPNDCEILSHIFCFFTDSINEMIKLISVSKSWYYALFLSGEWWHNSTFTLTLSQYNSVNTLIANRLIPFNDFVKTTLRCPSKIIISASNELPCKFFTPPIFQMKNSLPLKTELVVDHNEAVQFVPFLMKAYHFPLVTFKNCQKSTRYFHFKNVYLENAPLCVCQYQVEDQWINDYNYEEKQIAYKKYQQVKNESCRFRNDDFLKQIEHMDNLGLKKWSISLVRLLACQFQLGPDVLISEFLNSIISSICENLPNVNVVRAYNEESCCALGDEEVQFTLVEDSIDDDIFEE